MANTSLKKANKAKNDEFYTQLSDIEKECQHYIKHFKNKVVFCNCDDPYESNFFKYFAIYFNVLGLKKLIASCYIGSPITNKQLSLFDHENAENKTTKHPHRIEITEMADENAGDMKGLPLVEYILRNRKNALTRLHGDGDFRSHECVEMLKEADIVVTNPPFSLFRDYVAQIMEYKKKFIIIGNKNAITYKEIFKLIKENKMWIGNTPMGIDMLFDIPEHFAKEIQGSKREGSGYKIINGVIMARAQAIWFTNLDIKKRHEDMILYKKYTPKEYPYYDNYDAIEVAKTAEIPSDYDREMGVPITFLDKYNPDQFEIIGLAADKRDEDDIFIKGKPIHLDEQHKQFVGMVLNGKATYARILVKRK